MLEVVLLKLLLLIFVKELEDKIMTLENQYKNEITFLKTELLRKERECEKLKIKHDDLNVNLIIIRILFAMISFI